MEQEKFGSRSFFNVLTIIFVIARLLDVIDWSWWLVLSPAIIEILVFLFMVMAGVIIAVADKYGSD